jgi:hypothetical protein
MKSSIGALLDFFSQIVGLRRSASPKPLEPVKFDPKSVRPDSKALTRDELAARLHTLRPEVSIDDFRKQVENPIASRGIAIWVKVEILGREIILDSRVDNPEGMPTSLRDLPNEGPNSPWPEPIAGKDLSPRQGTVLKGHGGSSCPGMFSMAAVLKSRSFIEIPVEVLAFHVEGNKPEFAYGVSMFSEVTGRVSATTDADEKAALTMWGKMLISIRPRNPASFGGHELIQLRSRNYVEQHGKISGFPPHTAGEFLDSAGNEVYEGYLPGQRHLEAVVKVGRIIFSTDADDFLQARTRISLFELLDDCGNVLEAGDPPFSPDLVGRIGGVRLLWKDVRGEFPQVTHYRVYRRDPDEPQEVKLLGGMLSDPWFVDNEYDGTRSFTYAVLPAFVDSSGVEVQGVSLDHSTILNLRPNPQKFLRQNAGVGHIRWIG